MAVPNMIVTLVANTTKYSAGLKKAAADTNKFGSIVKVSFAAAGSAMLAMGMGLARLIPMLANAGAESRKADIQIKFMLENMQGVGKATNLTVQRMAEYADRVSKATGIDDEQIKAVQRKLLVFKSLRKTADEMGGTFDRTTKSAIDLAAAGFGDMESNAIKLGRILEDPVKNLNALNRAGIVFNAEERKKITALMESGKLLEAQNVVLKSIEKRVGGLAEVSATPFEKMVQQFNEMGDAIGEAMLPELEQMNIEISSWLSSAQGKQDMRDIIDAFVLLAQGIKDTVKALMDLKKWWDEVSGAAARYRAEAGYGGSYGGGTTTYPGAPKVNPSIPTPTQTKPSTASSITVNVKGITPTATVGKTVMNAILNAQRLGAR